MDFKEILKRVAKIDGGEKIRLALEKTQMAREFRQAGQKAHDAKRLTFVGK